MDNTIKITQKDINSFQEARKARVSARLLDKFDELEAKKQTEKYDGTT